MNKKESKLKKEISGLKKTVNSISAYIGFGYLREVTKYFTKHLYKALEVDLTTLQIPERNIVKYNYLCTKIPHLGKILSLSNRIRDYSNKVIHFSNMKRQITPFDKEKVKTYYYLISSYFNMDIGDLNDYKQGIDYLNRKRVSINLNDNVPNKVVADLLDKYEDE
jgi:hypothetical protein